MDRNESLAEEARAKSDFYEERLELQTVLTTVLSRSANLKKLLSYICERYFEGQTADIKEYTIAVDAFGRPPEFDPGIDSIIRVEAHRLRNKLELYYQQKGACHRVHIVLPPRGYVPRFIHLSAGKVSNAEDGPLSQSSQTDHPASAPMVRPSVLAAQNLSEVAEIRSRWGPIRFRTRIMLAAVFVFLLALAVWHSVTPSTKVLNRPQVVPVVRLGSESSTQLIPTSYTSSGVRIMAGVASAAVANENGDIWGGDRYFRGGDAESIAPKSFAFTTTPSIYFHRRRGDFRYEIPLPDGIYQLKLYFAEAFFGQDNSEQGGELSRLFDVKANGKTLLSNFDVIADAGGSNTADIKVFSDIKPAPDGLLHLDFLPRRNVAFVNAIEILSAPSHKILPIRIYTDAKDYKDRAGIVWNSDRFFHGGVHIHHLVNQSASADSSGFADERLGNFVYEIPVAENGVYTVKLRFCHENAFNPQPPDNGGNIFNVYLNGKTILEDFVMPTGSQPPGCVVKGFSGIKPNAQGKLILSFVPIRGYASLSSLEIDQE
jgi:hypothetical protein